MRRSDISTLLLLVALALCMGPLPAAAQSAKRPLSLDDLPKMRMVSDPQR